MLRKTWQHYSPAYVRPLYPGYRHHRNPPDYQLLIDTSYYSIHYVIITNVVVFGTKVDRSFAKQATFRNPQLTSLKFKLIKLSVG